MLFERILYIVRDHNTRRVQSLEQLVQKKNNSDKINSVNTLSISREIDEQINDEEKK